MRVLTLLLLLLAAPAFAADREHAFDFPDDRTTVRSPSGLWVANYHRLEDETQFRFAVQDKDGKELAGFDFLRSVDGAWEKRSNNLYVNNRTGSNSSDCLILTSTNDAMAFSSLRAALNAEGSVPKDSEWIKPAQLAEDAHYHLLCEKWSNDDLLDLVIAGHTDIEGGEFKYLLRYDVAKQAFSFRPN